jgi:hypothetical protein
MKKTIVFEVCQEEDGGFVAECLTENIFTQGDDWEVILFFDQWNLVHCVNHGIIYLM